jgi:CHAT domain
MLANVAPCEDYQTVTVRIFAPAAPGGDYPVEMSVLRWRDFPRVFFRLDQATLDARAADSNAYGFALGQMLFSDHVLGKAYGETIAAVHGRGQGLHIRLKVDPPDLHGIRWERIYHPMAGEWLPLGSTGQTPFSRYVPAQQWDRPLPVIDRPLRMLVVIASPNEIGEYGLDPIPDQESQSLHAALDILPEIELTYLESGTPARPTLNEIRKRLAEGFHFVFLLCHGARMPAGTVLYLEGEDHKVDPVKAERLVETFKILERPPSFCFLAACESAARTKWDAFLPLGPALVEDGGLQAVVAMTERVGLRTAQQFASQFFTRLLSHGIVDLAVNEARALVQDEWDWGAPVLFSRLPDNQLIDFPLGKYSHNYLSHTNRAFNMAGEALAAARRDNSMQLVGDLERLIKEMSKSHKVLVDYASSFREVGNDPGTFASRFEDFYYKFKQHYDGADWVDEDTSCDEIRMLGAQILPEVRPLIDPATFGQLEKELGLLGNADGMLMSFFLEFTEALNTAVEGIWAKVSAGDIADAIALKRGFEAQISPSFRRSKEMLAQMSRSVGDVKKA